MSLDHGQANILLRMTRQIVVDHAVLPVPTPLLLSVRLLHVLPFAILMMDEMPVILRKFLQLGRPS